MADLYANIGAPTVINRAFVPLAIQAGIEPVIKSMIGMWGMDHRSLLLAVKESLGESNASLAAALNLDNLAAVLDYMNRKDGAIVPMAINVPAAVPILDDADGPASVSAARDAGAPSQVNVSIPEAADPVTWSAYEIYIDGVYWQTGSNAPASGWVNDAAQNVPETAQTVRVLFVRTDDDGRQHQTRFGPIADLA